MEIKVNHVLTTEEAKKRILKLADELKKDYGSQISNYSEEWNGNSAEISFKAIGMRIKGNLGIFKENVVMDGKLPLAALPFRGQIERIIREKLVELLS